MLVHPASPAAAFPASNLWPSRNSQDGPRRRGAAIGARAPAVSPQPGCSDGTRVALPVPARSALAWTAPNTPQWALASSSRASSLSAGPRHWRGAARTRRRGSPRPRRASRGRPPGWPSVRQRGRPAGPQRRPARRSGARPRAPRHEAEGAARGWGGRFARRGALRPHYASPTIWPEASRSMRSAAGWAPRPGMVRISPQIG